MMEINLQLFGGGGSKSGLGKGSGGSGENEGKSQTYVFVLDAGEGFTETHKVNAKSMEEARKRAEKYAEKEEYFGVKEGYTLEEYKDRRNKNKKK